MKAHVVVLQVLNFVKNQNLPEGRGSAGKCRQNAKKLPEHNGSESGTQY